jgi:NAD(P)-dependent dehydrogenase (short-subunit alcohol dehydrogenase family)
MSDSTPSYFKSVADELPVQRAKTAIVTGGSSGIGLEMVKKLIEKGYRVVANSRNIASAMTLHNTADLKLVDGDIGIEETAKHVVRTAIQNFGTVDLLVNNAGVFIPKLFTEYTAEGQRRRTWQDSSMCRNSRWRKCVSRNSDTSSTSPRRW